MILDATAGNRTMWILKNCKDVIYIDMEKKLTVKPTIFADNTNTPFSDATFDTIFYDPPHFFNDTSSFYAIPDKETFLKKWQGYGEIPRYYGGDKYKSRTQLLKYIHNAQKEFQRILKPDGLLWMKWNESNITIYNIGALMEDWYKMISIKVRLNNPNRTQKQTYWECYTKKDRKITQQLLI